ncbi:MAG: Gfo/Idh/MocA family oxidoreductase [Pseudomonadota bacterium]|nr:Gfo/Idh/MocA family oxidoreductase [Pseudomonadota bacterium]
MKPDKKIRYGVVGGGWISQAAFMPGVKATGNSVLTAIVTGDSTKAEALGRRYGIERAYHYDAYLAALDSGGFDAIYLALPNFQHRQFAIPALERGIHVLLEKPMATSEQDCREIIDAARRGRAKLMIAYRLHFEPGTLEAIRIAQSGALGRLSTFSSTFTQHVEDGNHRAQNGFWSGPVADMGTYPINAVRNLFHAEPSEIMAWGTNTRGFGFHDTVSVTLRFPEDRLAHFTVGYGLTNVDEYRIVGDAGTLRVAPGFTLEDGLHHTLTVGESTTETDFRAIDQFAGETAYFSDCILEGRDPEPDGEEGLLDVRVLAAIEESLATGRAQELAPAYRNKHAMPDQRSDFPPAGKVSLIHAAPPAG